MTDDTTTTTAVEEAIVSLRETEGRTFTLAGLAECDDPDSDDSPGADFLRRVAGDVIDRVEWHREQGDDLAGVDWSDVAHEVADGCVPVYTYGMWQTFVDLAAWQEDPMELGGGEDMTRSAMVCLYLIGERLALALLEEVREAAKTEDAADDEDEETAR